MNFKILVVEKVVGKVVGNIIQLPFLWQDDNTSEGVSNNRHIVILIYL